jgi:hypothetical protein
MCIPKLEVFVNLISRIVGVLFMAAFLLCVPSAAAIRHFKDLAHLSGSDTVPQDLLGSAVAINGNTIALGAQYETVNDIADAGAVYLYVKPENGWGNMTQIAKLTASDPTVAAEFGSSIAISGNTIVVGAYLATVGSHKNQGEAYVFVKPTSGWTDMTETAKLTSSDGTAEDLFGASVGIDGNTIAVGAAAKQMKYELEGAAYVFIKPSTGWQTMTETAELTASNGVDQAALGSSIAVSGKTVVSGAPYQSVKKNLYQGAVYVFVPSA